jgi:hypothetical protein
MDKQIPPHTGRNLFCLFVDFYEFSWYNSERFTKRPDEMLEDVVESIFAEFLKKEKD